MGAQGTATVDFGAFPGATDTSFDVTGQASITAASLVEAWVVPIATSDHTADEHMLERIKVRAGNIVPGVGFTIYAFIDYDPVHIAQGDSKSNAVYARTNVDASDFSTRLYGQFTIGWVWNTVEPVVSAVSPSSGRSNQTQSVTLTGYAFTGATTVTFGGVAATGVTVVDDNTITCTTPTGTAGFADVSVTTAGGTGTTVDAYFYLDSTSLMGWWKADLGVTVDGSNGVSQLDDQSGNADANRNLAAATNRPTYFTIDTSLNNKPSWGTPGVDADVALETGTWSATTTSVETVYHVFYLPAALGQNLALRMGPAGAYAGGPSFVIDTALATYQSNDGANFINTSVAVSTPYVLCSVYNGAASAATYLSRWNTPAVTGNAGATGSDYLRTGTIVGGFPTQYRESEIIVFSGAHNSAKRQEIMEYLGAKYNIAVAA